MDGLNASELCEELLSVAATIRDNGGWHIAALKVEAAAELIGRLQRELVEAKALLKQSAICTLAEADAWDARYTAFLTSTVGDEYEPE